MPPPPKRDLPPYVHQSGNSTYEYRINLPRRPDGTRPKPVRQGGFSDPYDAHRAAQVARRRLGASSPEEIENAGITLIDWCRECMDRKRGVKTATMRMDEFALRVIAAGRMSGARIDRLRPLDLQNWFDELADQHGPSTVGRARSVINQSLNRAVKLQVLPANPVALVTTPPPEPRPRSILTPAQAQRLLAEAQQDADYALWLVLALMQLRPGEALALAWSDIDTTRHVLHVRRTLTMGTNRNFVVGDSAKSPTSHRTIDTLEVVERALLKLAQDHEGRMRRGELHPRFRDQGLVFPNTYGDAMCHTVVNARLRKLCQRAGVPKITGHSLRHTGATWLRFLGVEPEVVARRLGHRNTKLVLDLYSNPLPDEQSRASRHLEQHLRMMDGLDAGSPVDTPPS